MSRKWKAPNLHEGRENTEFLDPEFRYRSGFQHGATMVLNSLGLADGEPWRKWIEIELQRWRHSPDAEPSPPPVPAFSKEK